MLEEQNLWNFIEKSVAKPTNSMLLVDYKKKMAKSKHVILDTLKNHLIHHTTKKTTRKNMSDALVTLYNKVIF